jgi:hypothetical protein
MADKLKSEQAAAPTAPGLAQDSIAHFSQGDLRRFIVNLLLSDPGALPRQAAAPSSVSTGGSSPLTTKGDIYTRDGSADARQAVGADGTTIIADSTQATGWKWAAGGTFTPPTGTGFVHMTAGVLDVASKLVDTADVNNDQITYPKIQNVVANNRVLGRISGAGGDIEELTAAQVNTLTGFPGVPTGTGFTHETAGVQDAAAKLVDTADINNDQVTYAKLQNVAANNRILGRVSGAGGDVEELTAAQVNTLTGNPGFTPTGTGFTHETAGVQDAAAKLVDTADINANQVTNAKLGSMASQRIKGRTTVGIGDPEDLTPAQALAVLGTAATPTGTGFTHETAGVQDAAAKLVDTADINNSQVTYGKMQVESGGTMLGRGTGGDGTVAELFIGDVRSFLQIPSTGYNPGNVVWGTERFEVQWSHLKLSSTNRLTLQGTNEVLLADLGEYIENYVGQPKRTNISQVVRDGFRLETYGEFALRDAGRLDLRGDADLWLTDDFGARPRITLSGRV